MKEKFVAALLVFLCLTVRSFADEGDVVSAPATDSLVVGTTVIGDVLLECADKGSWTFSMGPKTMLDGTLELAIELSSPTAAVPPKFTVSFSFPQCDTWYRWTHETEKFNLPPDWKSKFESRLSSGYPFFALIGGEDKNRLTVAYSEAMRRVVVERAGGSEHSGLAKVRMSFFTEPDAPVRQYTLRLRIDRRNIYFGDAIAQAAVWVERAAELTPACVPEAATDPVYSTWFTFHQNLSAADVEAECAEAVKLGMKVVIVDDGWQADEAIGGYAYCGDWELSKKKFPDMAAHVRRVQAMGMKYVLWYSVPFVGVKSKNFNRFKGKFVSNQDIMGGRILDPRFPEVREFLCGVYSQAMREWGLDGLKLDFVDYVKFSGADPAVKENYAGRDIKSLTEAMDRLMKDIYAAITAVKPDALIEFRQSYTGPAMRQYGNMLRARDCPGDIIANRTRIANIRLAGGGTPAHSDMLVWSFEDRPESSARFILSTLFGVVQYSVMLRTIPEDHRRMLAHWIRFSQEHKHALLHGRFMPLNYDGMYSVIASENDRERIVAVYGPGAVANLGKADRDVYLLNGTTGEMVYVDVDVDAVQGELFDTYGVWAGQVALKRGVQRIEMPACGYLRIPKAEIDK